MSAVEMSTFSQLKGTCGLQVSHKNTFEDLTTMYLPRDYELLPKCGLCDMSPVQMNLIELARLVVMAALFSDGIKQNEARIKVVKEHVLCRGANSPKPSGLFTFLFNSIDTKIVY